MQKAIQNAKLAGSYGHPSFGTNNPHTGDTQKQYFTDETKLFNQMNLKYGSNVVNAQVQGVDYEDFYAYATLTIRVSAVIDPTTGANLGDDWRRVTVANGNIDFIPRGAKIVFNGNTWLVVNPSNVLSVLGTAIIRRCNATWKHLDAGGGIIAEPFCYGQGGNDLATANMVKENMILLNAYQHCVMQLNSQTAELRHNMRMILGNQAFTVRGVQNFVQEFSQDQSSVHLQYFDMAAAEPLDSDDMVNKIAGGLKDRPARVETDSEKAGLAWKVPPPQAITQYGKATFEAAFYAGGKATAQAVSYTMSGADHNAYAATVTENAVAIKCWQPCNVPLTVTAACDGMALTTEIMLEGW